eukprot:gene17876-6329_t
MSRRKSFAAELNDLLSPGAGDDDDGGAAIDDAEEWGMRDGDAARGGRLRMRARLDPSFATGRYKGRVVGKRQAFGGGGDDEGTDEEEAEGEDQDEVEEEEELEDEGDPSDTGGDEEGGEEEQGDEGEEEEGEEEEALDEDAAEAKMDDVFAGFLSWAAVRLPCRKASAAEARHHADDGAAGTYEDFVAQGWAQLLADNGSHCRSIVLPWVMPSLFVATVV